MGNKHSSILKDEEIKIISSHTGFSASQIEKLHSRFCQLDKNNRGFIGKAELLSIPELAVNPIRYRLLNALGVNTFNDPNFQSDQGIDFITFLKNLAIFHDNCGGSKLTDLLHRQSITTSSRIESRAIRHNGDVSVKSMKTDVPTDGIDLSKFNSSTSKQWDSKYKLNGIDINETKREKMLLLFKLYDHDNDGRISFIDLRSLIKTLVGDCMDDIELDKIALRAFVEVDEHSDGFIDFGEFCQVFDGKDLESKLRIKFFH